jgi:hypothetical protein
MRRLAGALEANSRGSTSFAVCLDEDDPVLTGYEDIPHTRGRWSWVIGPRRNLTEWTNAMAELHLGAYDFFVSMGDDHVPHTVGWDERLMSVIGARGGTGFAYGNDWAMGERLPTSVCVSADIVRALGWFCLPSLAHYCVDNVWLDLGEAADCLTYRPDVVIEHLHYTTGRAQFDQTYADAGGFTTAHPDYQAYLDWREHGFPGDVEKIRALR